MKFTVAAFNFKILALQILTGDGVTHMIFILFRMDYAPILNIIQASESFFDTEFTIKLIVIFLVLTCKHRVRTGGRILHLLSFGSLHVDGPHTYQIWPNIA